MGLRALGFKSDGFGLERFGVRLGFYAEEGLATTAQYARGAFTACSGVITSGPSNGTASCRFFS